ncbi:unnamed protein product, partial [marine sediment metagenome]
MATLNASQGFIIQGDQGDTGQSPEDRGDNAGASVSSAGDVNGDGFDDLIVGAPWGDDGGSYAGEAYVVFGSGTGFGTLDPATGRQVIDLATLAPSQGFIIQGDDGGEREPQFGFPGELTGLSVSSAGDINGDGFDDMIVGAPFGDIYDRPKFDVDNDGDLDGFYAGVTYVVFGSGTGFGALDPTTGRQVLDMATLEANQGFILIGDPTGAGSAGAGIGGRAGRSV